MSDEERLARRRAEAPSVVLLDIETGGPADARHGAIAVDVGSSRLFTFDGRRWVVIASAAEAASRG